MITFKTQKRLSILLAIALFISIMAMSIPASAHEQNESKVYITVDPETGQEVTVFEHPEMVDPTIQPRYEGVCNGHSYHDMVQKGMGTAENSAGELIVYNACFFQCSRCHQVMLTTGNPRLGEIIYIYAVWNASAPVTTSFVYIKTDFYNICNSSSMSGYQFR